MVRNMKLFKLSRREWN